MRGSNRAVPTVGDAKGDVDVSRPERKLKSLKDKIEQKQGRQKRATGKRLKRWKKWAEKYQPLAG